MLNNSKTIHLRKGLISGGMFAQAGSKENVSKTKDKYLVTLRY